MLDADSGVLQLHKQWHIDLFFCLFCYWQDLYSLLI